MPKNRIMDRLMRFLITLLGIGVGAALATLLWQMLGRFYPELAANPATPFVVFGVLCLVFGLVFYLIAPMLIKQTMQLTGAIARRWETMPGQQVIAVSIGLLLGLAVAALLTQLVLSAGPSLFTISFSTLMYLVLGSVGIQVGNRRYKNGKKMFPGFRRRMEQVESSLLADDGLFGDEQPQEDASGGIPPKVLDTSVIIDGRVLDIVKTGFLEGDLVIPQFVLAELRHIADSGDTLRRARGRRGLDVLTKLQKELNHNVIVDETDYEDAAEVDVKLLRLCKDKGGIVVTNDYNLNKVAGVTGIQVLNINDLANAVKPMLMAGEELAVQVVREGKEPGQGIAYLDDGTMIVVDGGRRYVGETVTAVVATVLQTSAGRMIFAKVKAEERP